MSDRIVHDLAEPILRTWASESHLESTALLQENAMEWMFDNYINLMGYQNYKTKEFFLEIIPRHDPAYDEKTLCSWVRCPFIEFYSISHNFVKNNFADILDYIIYTVEKGYNIYVKVIQKFLSVRMPSMYNTPFIYCFEKRKSIIYLADHYDQGKYMRAELGLDEFLRAYNFTYWDEDGCHLLDEGDDSVREREQIYIARPRAFKYKFNADWFLLQLRDYLDSTYRLDSTAAVTEGTGYKRYFGIASYDLLTDYMDVLARGESDIKDWRLFTMLCDHKKLFRLRMEFLRSKGICPVSDTELERFIWLSQMAEKVLGLFLKYLISKKSNVLQEIKEDLSKMKEVEYKMLLAVQGSI